MATLQTSINAGFPFTVAQGGTGVATLTNNGVTYYAAGTGTFGAVALNNGQLLIGRGGNTPIAAVPTSGDGSITISPSSGALDFTVTAAFLTSLGTVTTGTWSAELKDYTEVIQTANSGTAYTINLANGNWQEITLTGNCTFSFSGVPATAGQGVSLTLALIQDATGTRTVTWPASVDWGLDGPPTLSTTPGQVDLIVLMTANNGTRWRSMLSAKGFGG